MIWQGQHLGPAMPTAAMHPMAGRANYALYIIPSDQAPAAISADIRYFSEARYPLVECVVELQTKSKS